MKIAIVGSRTFEDYDLLKRSIPLDDVTAVISGGAKGADTLAERFAEEHGLEMVVFKPDYKTHGKAAPFIRNGDIVETADVVYAFWDGRSTGTLDSINKARTLNKSVIIVLFKSTPIAKAVVQLDV